MEAMPHPDLRYETAENENEKQLEQMLGRLRAEVSRNRELQEQDALAQSLEDYASASMKLADVIAAAGALAEASQIWRALGCVERAGSALLLATSSYRLAGAMDSAAELLHEGLAADFPERLHQGFEMEAAEQCLARGEAEAARQAFSRLMDRAGQQWPLATQARVLERRAAAAQAHGNHRTAAADLLQASQLYSRAGAPDDSETAALAAAALLADEDAALADRVVREVTAVPAAHGAAAARRGLVGGHVAMRGGGWGEALRRLDQARQGALDCRDPVTYLLASVQASEAAEKGKDFEAAYGRLATAWTTLSDLLGREMAAEQVRPCLQALRNRLGQETFQKAKQNYEQSRRRQLAAGSS